jgi:hypothetical protein
MEQQLNVTILRDAWLLCKHAFDTIHVTNTPVKLLSH